MFKNIAFLYYSFLENQGSFKIKNRGDSETRKVWNLSGSLVMDSFCSTKWTFDKKRTISCQQNDIQKRKDMV